MHFNSVMESGTETLGLQDICTHKTAAATAEHSPVREKERVSECLNIHNRNEEINAWVKERKRKRRKYN